MPLSENEIDQRLVRLRNLELLHLKARERIILLEKENRELRQRIKELEDGNNDQNTKIEALSFQFEQIKNKLFGKKPTLNLLVQKKKKKIRNTFSYQRPIPKNVTRTKPHMINQCGYCHGALKKKRVKVFFEEDIPLPIEKNRS